MPVLEVRGRDRRHEHFRWRHAVERGLEIVDVALEQRLSLVGDRPGADHVVGPRRAEIAGRVVEFRERQRLARLRPMTPRTASLIGLEAAEPLVHVGDEARLAVFAVIDHVDAELDLLAHDLADRALEPTFVGLLVARGLRIHHGEQISRPRQAADMRGENAVGAAFHRLAPVRLFVPGIAAVIPDGPKDRSGTQLAARCTLSPGSRCARPG